jgi:glutamate dehydrogenase/leucine dehydrogenase
MGQDWSVFWNWAALLGSHHLYVYRRQYSGEIKHAKGIRRQMVQVRDMSMCVNVSGAMSWKAGCHDTSVGGG